MRYFIRTFLFYSFSLWFITEICSGLSIQGGWQAFFIAGCILSILMLIVAPILRILFIPINILTFGVLSWGINVLVLYLLTIIVPEVTIQAWEFPGWFWAGFAIPSLSVSYVLSLVLVSLMLTGMVNILQNISEH